MEEKNDKLNPIRLARELKQAIGHYPSGQSLTEIDRWYAQARRWFREQSIIETGMITDTLRLAKSSFRELKRRVYAGNRNA